MNLSSNTILITGGATGLGLGLAELLLKDNNEIIICGRRHELLEAAKLKFPALHIRYCDLSVSAERIELISWVTTNFPAFNMLVNNAGIQKYLDFSEGKASFSPQEIEINLTAPIHLSQLVLPGFLEKENAAIVNISSGLGFVPAAFVPVYSATKAALHSFSRSLRHQLKDSQVRVFEIAPPLVDTDLDKGARDTHGIVYKGISTEEFSKEAIMALKDDVYNAPIGQAKNLFAASRSETAEAAFQQMNSR